MLDDAATPGKAIEMATPTIPQTDRHGVPVLQGPYTPEGQPMLCKRCGRPLTDPERQADGMGMCCRAQEPHRRRIQFLGVQSDGASVFTIYSLTRGGRDTKHTVRVHFEHGEFGCSCEDFTYRQRRCKHVARACEWEKRRRAAIPPTIAPTIAMQRSFGAPAAINYDTCLED